MEFDRTESSHTERKIQEATMRLQIGTVATVFEHTKKDDNSNFECNVILRDEEKERRRVKIMTPRKGEIHAPEQGDNVVVGFLDGETEDPIILGNYYNIRDRPPLGKAGMYRLKRNNLFVEMEPDGKYARVSRKATADDQSPPDATIEIKENGGNPIVKVTGEDAPMGLRLDLSSGKFKLRDGGGYGIESDGAGNFTWYHESVDFNEGSTMSGW